MAQFFRPESIVAVGGWLPPRAFISAAAAGVTRGGAGRDTGCTEAARPVDVAVRPENVAWEQRAQAGWYLGLLLPRHHAGGQSLFGKGKTGLRWLTGAMWAVGDTGGSWYLRVVQEARMHVRDRVLVARARAGRIDNVRVEEQLDAPGKAVSLVLPLF